MKKILAGSLILLFACSMSAQSFIEFPEISTPSGQDKTILLKRLHISVFVMENIATTSLEMQFYNPNNRIMEGELNFPLPNGVTVSRFALDVNGEMREGVVVDKEQATQAFENIIRRNIDPGLVEVTRGNNFKARVYPIPARGYKKCIIAFEQELRGDDLNYIYQLPVNLKHRLEDFSVRVEVVMNRPQVPKSDHPHINLEFKEERNSYIAEYQEKDFLPDTRLAFSMPKPTQLSDVLTYQGKITSDNYFYIHLNIKKESREKPKPKKITIIWDVSASAKDRDFEKEIKILEEFLAWMKQGTIEIMTFSNALHTQNTFNLRAGSCEELIEFIRNLHYDGGTNLFIPEFCMTFPDEILLFTDGLSNFGERWEPDFEAPVSAINSSGIADHNLLEYFASVSNGQYINAFTLTETEVIDRLTHEQKQFISADYDPYQIDEFYPSTGQTITDQFSCAGMMEGSKSEITLHFGFGNEVTESKTILIDNTQSIPNAIGERIWAQKKLKELLIQDDASEIKTHGKKFSLVTPGTSLIVLEDVEDYVRYEIPPPASLKSEYNRIIAENRLQRKTDRRERLERICEQFQEDYQWWESAVDYRGMTDMPDLEETDSIVVLQYMDDEETGEVLYMSIDASEEEELEEDMIYYDMSADMPEPTAGYGDHPRYFAEPATLDEIVVVEDAMTETQVLETGVISSTATVRIINWDSDASYMNKLKSADAANLYEKYLELRDSNAENPSFYFDVASYMFRKEQQETGLRILSNMAELELENAEILRTMGRKLLEHGFCDEAIATFKEVMDIRSFEPHSYIDLGLAYAGKGEYQKALDQLYTIIEKDWDQDIYSLYPGIELIVLHEINNLIHQHEDELEYAFIDTCFLKHMPVDIRIVIDWDANNTDIDLWITDPRGEKCSYSNKDTRIGGKLSNDITQGYGPEEYRLRYAIDGKYIIESKFYGSTKQSLLSNVTVRAIVYTRFGTDEETMQVLTLQLTPSKEGEYVIGEIGFEKDE